MKQCTESLFVFLFHGPIPVELAEVQLQSGSFEWNLEFRRIYIYNLFLCGIDVFKAYLAFVVRSK